MWGCRRNSHPGKMKGGEGKEFGGVCKEPQNCSAPGTALAYL